MARLSADNFTQVFMQALMHQGDFTKINIRFMTFGVDGVSIFQGTRLGVTLQILMFRLHIS